MSPRPYNLGARLVAAEQTRARILAAARELLKDEEFCGLSIDAIARRAGVARMTVYYQFTSRRRLLEALYDDLGARGFADDLAAVHTETNPLLALNRLIAAISCFWAAERVVFRRLRGLAVVDPEVDAGIRERDQRRREHVGRLLRQLAEERGWESRVSIEEATSVVAAMLGFGTFDEVAGESGDPVATTRVLQQSAAAVLGLN